MARRASTPRGSAKARPTVESLLEERQTISKWLARLSESDDTPAELRSKVQADYETRMNTVREHLQGYAAELRDSLTKETVKQGGLLEKEESAEGRLGEAKLRHSVGEYTEDQWDKINSEIQGELGDVRKQLKVVEVEVARLEDVISSIDKPREAEDHQVPLTELEPSSLGDAGELATIQPGQDASGDDGKAAKRPSGQTEAFNELEFLKKVAPDAGKRRRSGASFRPIEPEDVPKPKASPLDAAPSDATATASKESIEVGPKEDDTAKKTLKCGECGAMNRPTEWYCESCGAELAVV